MTNSLTKLIQQKITLILVVTGLLMIIVASTFHTEVFKVPVDHVMAEVGALFLIVGTLHWMFENLLRKEMLKDIATTALGNARIHDSGIVDCILNSKEISETNLWKASQQFIIGIHYSPAFLERIHSILKERCASGKSTEIYIVKPDSIAADYLTKSRSRIPDVGANIRNIQSLAEACGPERKNIKLYYHERVLRYVFIYTEQSIWIHFYTNSEAKTEVPAFKVETGTPLFKFFENDIKLFMDEVNEIHTAPNNSMDVRAKQQLS